MSQENVAVVRRALEAFSRRDRETWLSCCDPDMESSPSGDWPETAMVRGRDAVWDFFIQAEDPWEQGTYQLPEVIDASEGGVVAHQVRQMRGRDSGATVSYDYWVVSRFRAGKVARVEWFGTREEAFNAVGLEE